MSFAIKALCCLAYLMNAALVSSIVFILCALFPNIWVLLAGIAGAVWALVSLNEPIIEIWKNTTERDKP